MLTSNSFLFWLCSYPTLFCSETCYACQAPPIIRIRFLILVRLICTGLITTCFSYKFVLSQIRHLIRSYSMQFPLHYYLCSIHILHFTVCNSLMSLYKQILLVYVATKFNIRISLETPLCFEMIIIHS